MAGMHYIKPQQAEALVSAIFVGAGAPPDIAAHVANHLVESNLAGHDSHGIMRVPEYIRWMDAGNLVPSARPKIVKETETTALVDGNKGFGQYNASFATDLVLNKAQEHNVASVALRNGGHIGRLGHYSEVAAQRGLVLLMTFGSFSHSGGLVAPYGGTKRTLGTNPWSIGIPVANHAPLVVDFATATVAEGKVRVARDKHLPLPPGCILDANGNPSTNPEDFYNGGVLLPFGGHKGSALSLVAAIFGAGMTGTLHDGSGGGVFLIAVNPAAFVPLEEFKEITEQAVDSVKNSVPAAGQREVMVPGEPEQYTRQQRTAGGIGLPDDTWEQICSVASRYGVILPETRHETQV